MRDDQQQLKIELLSQWKLEAESRNRFETNDDNDKIGLRPTTIMTK